MACGIRRRLVAFLLCLSLLISWSVYRPPKAEAFVFTAGMGAAAVLATLAAGGLSWYCTKQYREGMVEGVQGMVRNWEKESDDVNDVQRVKSILGMTNGNIASGEFAVKAGAVLVTSALVSSIIKLGNWLKSKAEENQGIVYTPELETEEAQLIQLNNGNYLYNPALSSFSNIVMWFGKDEGASFLLNPDNGYTKVTQSSSGERRVEPGQNCLNFSYVTSNETYYHCGINGDSTMFYPVNGVYTVLPTQMYSGTLYYKNGDVTNFKSVSHSYTERSNTFVVGIRNLNFDMRPTVGYGSMLVGNFYFPKFLIVPSTLATEDMLTPAIGISGDIGNITIPEGQVLEIPVSGVTSTSTADEVAEIVIDNAIANRALVNEYEYAQAEELVDSGTVTGEQTETEELNLTQAQALLNEIKGTFYEKFPFIPDLLNFWHNIVSLEPEPPVVYIHLESARSPSGIDYGGTEVALDLSWYSEYKQTVDSIISGFLWLGYLWLVFKRLSAIIRGGEMVNETLPDVEAGFRPRGR